VSLDPIREGTGLRGRVAVVTGASSGIGRAIAVALSRQGARLCIIGRNPVTLAETAAVVRRFSEVREFRIDLAVEGNLQPLIQYIEAETGRVDILIHSAGVIRLGPMDVAQLGDLDLQYATNVRAPYMLTQRLMLFLTAARGQVVFINSTAGLSAKRSEAGQYAATKHALKAIADSLREEVNPKGIRVLTMYLGRTATPMQEALYRQDGMRYDPDALVQPEDVASVVVQALLLPATVEVTDISMRPMLKSY
jgi:NADP-dependent 3-hydroxy acid dehydrogenase YdfG